MPEGGTVVVPGAFSVFSNADHGVWTARPNTVLIDSEQLESGEAMSADFKKIAAREIEEFKTECRLRFPGRDVEKLTDEDLLREVMNTVGKTGRLGEHVKCVVSVSMLTEGWDANTVTHILGVRAFGTQLLCEQVVGRGLRRMGYTPQPCTVTCGGKKIEFEGYPPQYAEVYGVPFSFIPCAGSSTDPKPSPPATRVRALDDRIACEVTFPRVAGYRYDLPGEKLSARFTDDSRLPLSTADVPTRTEVAPIVGQGDVHTLEGVKALREQEVAFRLAKLILEQYFRDDDGNPMPWLFPQTLAIVRRWMAECVVLKDNAFMQMLWLTQYRQDAADRIYKAIVKSTEGEKALKPILAAYNVVGSTRYVDFDTTRNVYPTDARFCHISHVVCDTDSWEQKMAQALEELGEEGVLVSYAKNHNLSFFIPYALDGEEHNYIPDFLVRFDDGGGRDDPLNLIIEVTGEPKRDKAAKVSTARDLWVPAVNNHGGFGRWAFIEIADPWDAKNTISTYIRKRETNG